MPRQPPGHARVCRRHRPMCAGSAAICWTAWNWRAGASSRVSSPGPRQAPRRRWMRWNRSSPGISRPGSEAARRRSGTRRPAIRGELPLAADHGTPQSRAGRSAGAGHSPQRVGTRPGERAVRDCVRLGRLRVRGRTRAAPLRNSRAIRPHLLPGRIAPRCPEPPAAPASDARAHVPRFRSRTVWRDVWPGGRHGCEAEARSLAHGPAAAPADGVGAGWARIRPPRPAARGGRAVSTTGGSHAGASIRRRGL